MTKIMSLLTAVLMVIAALEATAQPGDYPKNLNDLTKKNLPREVKAKGKFIAGKSWADKQGENIFVIYLRGPGKEKEQTGEDGSGTEYYAELFACRYINPGTGYELLWTYKDSVRHCPFDMWLGLIPNSIKITDLDGNGAAEVLFITRSACRSDISPSFMRVIMAEGSTLMKLEGLMAQSEIDANFPKIDIKHFEPDQSKIDTTRLSSDEKFFLPYGRYTGAEEFKGKPRVFLDYARRKWLEYVKADAYGLME